MAKLNARVLMSGTDYFRVEELNPYEHQDEQPDPIVSKQEHESLKQALELSGIDIVKVPPPYDCQDGIYTANWALCWRSKAVLSSLPNKRQGEQPYAKQIIESLGYEVITPPCRFSGQGDCLPCGNYLFVGSKYRTDLQMHELLKQIYGCEVIGLATLPALDSDGRPVINAVTGWPDSYFYDVDLALSVITPELIAWCPEAFSSDSRNLIESLPLEKISVSLEEAKQGFACNLVSTGETVIMSNRAPALREAIEKQGLKTLTPDIRELSKGGGYIRCCSLTLD
jgi:N-dimethylarginine dimethylaminohydrolase